MSRNMYPTLKHINKSKDQQYIFPLREKNLSNRIHKLSELTAVDVALTYPSIHQAHHQRTWSQKYQTHS